jgi:hypothetical protein
VLFRTVPAPQIAGRGARAARIVAATSRTDGSQTGILGIEVGGSRRPFTLGDLVLLTAFDAGFHWAAMLLEYAS